MALQASDTVESGILVGKLTPKRKIGANTGRVRERIVAVYPQVVVNSESLDSTPAQLGLAF